MPITTTEMNKFVTRELVNNAKLIMAAGIGPKYLPLARRYMSLGRILAVRTHLLALLRSFGLRPQAMRANPVVG